MPPEPHPLAGRQRVEVLVDGRWLPGTLRSCDHSGDERWTCLVTWNPVPGAVRTDRFPVEDVR